MILERLPEVPSGKERFLNIFKDAIKPLSGKNCVLHAQCTVHEHHIVVAAVAAAVATAVASTFLQS